MLELTICIKQNAIQNETTKVYNKVTTLSVEHANRQLWTFKQFNFPFIKRFFFFVIENPFPSSTKLLCAVCKDDFTNPWDLMVHSQAAHMINIYELGNENTNNNIISKNGNRDTLMIDDQELSDNLLSPRSSASKEVSQTFQFYHHFVSALTKMNG